jgi:hypothetical protein
MFGRLITKTLDLLLKTHFIFLMSYWFFFIDPPSLGAAGGDDASDATVETLAYSGDDASDAWSGCDTEAGQEE